MLQQSQYSVTTPHIIIHDEGVFSGKIKSEKSTDHVHFYRKFKWYLVRFWHNASGEVNLNVSR